MSRRGREGLGRGEEGRGGRRTRSPLRRQALGQPAPQIGGERLRKIGPPGELRQQLGADDVGKRARRLLGELGPANQRRVPADVVGGARDQRVERRFADRAREW